MYNKYKIHTLRIAGLRGAAAHDGALQRVVRVSVVKVFVKVFVKGVLRSLERFSSICSKYIVLATWKVFKYININICIKYKYIYIYLYFIHIFIFIYLNTFQVAKTIYFEHIDENLSKERRTPFTKTFTNTFTTDTLTTRWSAPSCAAAPRSPAIRKVCILYLLYNLYV